MQFLDKVKLIQGGMGIYVSTWQLAQAVAREKPGVTAGTVSGTALDIVYVRLLQLGDPDHNVRRALMAFDTQFRTDIGQRIIARYFIEGGKLPRDRFANAPRQRVRIQDELTALPPSPQNSVTTTLTLEMDICELLIVSGFAEVWLAKEQHNGRIFINFLNKVELPLIPTMYGAMLAGVDGVIVGAGNPDGLPAICSRLANHEAVSKDLAVLYRESNEVFNLHFDPQLVAGGKLTIKPLRRPAFLAIVSLENLAKSLAQSHTQTPDGFIIEHHTAGGHNAGPQGPMKKDSKGQPIYGKDDEPDLESIRNVGLPFWLAGGYGSRVKLQQALAAGATGIQVGSVLALTQESGMKPTYRTAILNELKKGTDETMLVLTTLFSPTGFPFKVVQLNDTLSNEAVYASRRRMCDVGLLQQRGLGKPDQDGTRQLFLRCPAEPIEHFIRNRGLPNMAEDRRCLCNGLLACVGLAQVNEYHGVMVEEPAIVTLGNHLDGVRRLSHNGHKQYCVHDVVIDILGSD